MDLFTAMGSDRASFEKKPRGNCASGAVLGRWLHVDLSNAYAAMTGACSADEHREGRVDQRSFATKAVLAGARSPQRSKRARQGPSA